MSDADKATFLFSSRPDCFFQEKCQVKDLLPTTFRDICDYAILCNNIFHKKQNLL